MKNEIKIYDFLEKDSSCLYQEFKKAMDLNQNNENVIILNFQNTNAVKNLFLKNTLGRFIKENKKEGKEGIIRVKNIDSISLRTIRLVISDAKA